MEKILAYHSRVAQSAPACSNKYPCPESGYSKRQLLNLNLALHSSVEQPHYDSQTPLAIKHILQRPPQACTALSTVTVMRHSPIGYVRDRYHQGQKYVLQWLADATGASTATTHHTGQLEIKAADIDELGDRLLHTTKKMRKPPKNIELCIKLLEHVIAGRKEGASW